MYKLRIGHLSLFILLLFMLASCNAPRSILQSGKVLPKGQFRGGINYTFNISTAPIEKSIKGAYDLTQSMSTRDTVFYSKQVEAINTAFMAYCLDPITFNDEVYFRFGMGNNLDMGFRTAGGAHSVDIMYQFLGSNQTFQTSDKGGMYGSVGLQYSWENYRFLKYPMFDKLEKMFNFQMSRKDITLPIIFSKSFGPEERTGCFSFGVMYSHSFIKYKIEPKNIYKIADQTGVNPVLLDPVEAKMNFGAYGAFFNVKVGKKYVFFNFSLAAYYQKYGKFPLIGGSTASFEGFSFVPSYGIQFNILPKSKKKGTEI